MLSGRKWLHLQAEPLDRAVELGLDRSDRAAEQPGDLFQRQTREEAQKDHLAILRRELLDQRSKDQEILAAIPLAPGGKHFGFRHLPPRARALLRDLERRSEPRQTTLTAVEHGKHS